MTGDQRRTIESYLVSSGIFDANDNLKTTNLYEELDEIDGYVNLIFRVQGRDRSVIIKQVLPYMRVLKEAGIEHSINMDRMHTEIAMLIFISSLYPDFAPEIYLFDEPKALIVMEDLSDFDLLRSLLNCGKSLPMIGAKLGTFLAALFYFTSRLHLNTDDFNRLKNYFANDESKYMESLLFKEHVLINTERPLVPELADYHSALAADERLHHKILMLLDEYMSGYDCLLHNDFHTSNIMVKKDRIKVFDTEFSSFGHAPVDLGRITGSFMLNYLSWKYRMDQNSATRIAMQRENLVIIRELYTAFEKALAEFMAQDHHITHGKDAARLFMQDFIPKTLMYAGLGQSIRVTCDAAMSLEVKAIPEEYLGDMQKASLELTKHLVLHSEEYQHIDQLLATLGRWSVL